MLTLSQRLDVVADGLWGDLISRRTKDNRLRVVSSPLVMHIPSGTYIAGRKPTPQVI